MITKQMLEDAPVFTAFKGQAKNRLTKEQWGLFGIDGAGSVADDAVLEEAAKHGIQVACCAHSGMFVEPEFDEDHRDEVPDGSDTDAAVAYLSYGGLLAKLPDERGSEYNRFYVIMQAREWYKPDHKKYGCQCDADPIHPVQVPCPVHDR